MDKLLKQAEADCAETKRLIKHLRAQLLSAQTATERLDIQQKLRVAEDMLFDVVGLRCQIEIYIKRSGE